jgi:hypothetical protein
MRWLFYPHHDDGANAKNNIATTVAMPKSFFFTSPAKTTAHAY